MSLSEEIVYLRINDWIPSEDEEGLINDLLGFGKEWLRKNEICINAEVWDQSVTFWITCKRSWLEQNHPGLVSQIIKREPEHLNPSPENYGYHLITENT